MATLRTEEAMDHTERHVCHHDDSLVYSAALGAVKLLVRASEISSEKEFTAMARRQKILQKVEQCTLGAAFSSGEVG